MAHSRGDGAELRVVKLFQLRDSETGGRWLIRFQDGQTIDRRALAPVYDRHGKVLYHEYVMPHNGNRYVLTDD